jgi:hypothetical protein
MAARFGTANVDQAMSQLKEAMEQMPFAKYRFKREHVDLTRAMANLTVALEDVKPYLD